MFNFHHHRLIKVNQLLSTKCRMSVWLHWKNIFIQLLNLVIPCLLMRISFWVPHVQAGTDPIYYPEFPLTWSQSSPSLTSRNEPQRHIELCLVESCVSDSHGAPLWLMTPIWSLLSAIWGKCLWWWHIPPFNPRFPLKEDCSFMSSEDAPNKMDVPSYV